jgi:hypothetical protein
MNTILSLQPQQLKNLYNYLAIYKTKDNINMVLEPLQSMIQLALLSVLPIGTKLAIHDNILFLQTPSLLQPINRWYHLDKKDDLYYLFQVIKRFIKWYNPKTNISPITQDLYQLLITMTLSGLDNLIKTYQSNDNTSIIQVISMYKAILASNDTFDGDKQILSTEGINIDEIFINIIKLYNKNLINIIYNTLLIIKSEEKLEYINNYIDGLNLIMDKNNKMIHNWIRVHLII